MGELLTWKGPPVGASLMEERIHHSVWKPSREVQADVVPAIAAPIRLEIETRNVDTEIWIQLSRHLVETGGKSEESIALHLREVGQDVAVVNGMSGEDVEMVRYDGGLEASHAHSHSFTGRIHERIPSSGTCQYAQVMPTCSG
jgi:hypothetical protein